MGEGLIGESHKQPSKIIVMVWFSSWVVVMWESV